MARIQYLAWPKISPKTVDSPNMVHVLRKITGAIFCTQYVQCNDGGAGDKCMFLSVFTYSSYPLTQICEIVQLTRWAHHKFPQHFLPSSRHKKHGECLFLLLASKFRCAQQVNLMWLVSSGEEEQNVCIGVLKQSMFLLQQNCTTFLSSNTRGLQLHRPNSCSDTGEWRRLIKYWHSFEPFCWWHLLFASHAFAIF